MKNYIQHVANELTTDDAESTVISMVMLFPILLCMLITMIELPILFSDRNLLQTDLQQGARTAAILGSNGNQGALAATYADKNACSSTVHVKNGGTLPIMQVYSGGKRLVGEQSTVACETAIAIAQNQGFIAFDIYNVKCAPNLADRIGMPTTCEATYYYHGIPGGTMSMIGGYNHFGWNSNSKELNDIRNDAMQKAAKMGNESEHGFNSGVISMSAQSEVCLADDCKA